MCILFCVLCVELKILYKNILFVKFSVLVNLFIKVIVCVNVCGWKIVIIFLLGYFWWVLLIVVLILVGWCV